MRVKNREKWKLFGKIVELIELCKEVWKEPPWNEHFWTNEMVKEYALARGETILLAIIKKEVVGFTWGYGIPKEKFPFLKSFFDYRLFYIDGLAVKKDYRRIGIDSFLLKRLLEKALKEGFQYAIYEPIYVLMPVIFTERVGLRYRDKMSKNKKSFYD